LCNYIKTEGRSPSDRPSALQSLTAYLFLLAAFFAFLAPFLAAFFFVAIVKNFVELKCKRNLQRCIIFLAHNYSHNNVNNEMHFQIASQHVTFIACNDAGRKKISFRKNELCNSNRFSPM